tara:strand:- start:10777 stop:11520 length:744 start_codon:yes stop_codon:yes gene_type:complete
MKRFKDKTILVVGISSGIGQAVGKELATEGAIIVGIGRDEAKLSKAIKKLRGDKHDKIVGDVSQVDKIKEIRRLGKESGGYSGAVICSGMHEIRPLSVLNPSNVIESIEQNLVSALNCIRAVSKSSSSQGGSIVLMSSIAAFRGSAGFAAYSAAKGALISTMKVAAVELVSKKIRVNTIAAGVVETPMSDTWLSKLTEEQRNEVNKSHLLGIGKPKDIVGPILFLLSNESNWITGTTLVVDGGLSVR